MINKEQVQMLEDIGIQIRSHDNGLRQLGNIAKRIANKWDKLDFDTRNKLQKEFLGVELTTRQEDTNFLLKNSLKMTQELISAMQENAEMGIDLTMFDPSEVLYSVIDKAVNSNKYVDTSCTMEIDPISTSIQYSKDHNLGFVVQTKEQAMDLRDRYNYEKIYYMDKINETIDADIEGVLVDIKVPYSDFDEIPVKIKTGLVDALKGI